MSEPDDNLGSQDMNIVMSCDEPTRTLRQSTQEQPQEQQDNEEIKEKEGRKEMAPRSDMWQHFIKMKVDGLLKTGKCKYCSRQIKADPAINGTSALRKHYNICKRNPHVNNKDARQGCLQVTHGDSVSNWKFDPEAIRNAFTHMVIEDELPFAFAEKSGFRRYMAVVCPRFPVPSRRTITRDIVQTYFQEKAKLKKFFKDSCERVSLTTDCWTSQQQDSYMAVTAHFIDNDWKLHKKIIGFFMVKGHKGDDIGKNLQKCLLEWGIEKVMTITVDNASSNDCGINYMRKQMNNAKTSIYGGKYLHMRCAAHIINLIVSDSLKEVDISVKRVRAAVRFIKGGTSRLVKFRKCAELEKVETKAFLKLDICTRWNSTYLMLKAAIPYERVFSRYEEEDPYYVLELCGERGHGVPDEKDWDNVKKMAEFLRHFYDLTLSVSATLHVTSNSFFHSIGEVNALLTEWIDSEDPLRKLMGKRMKDKYDKYWGHWQENENQNENENENEKGKGKGKENMNMLIFIAVAIDPRYKLSDYTKLAVDEIFGEEKGRSVFAAVSSCFRKLFEEYSKLYSPTDVIGGPGQSTDSQEPTDSGIMKSKIVKKMRLSSSGASSKSELDKYLAEDNEVDRKKFDILAWWNVHSARFPILSRLARDVLAIPISTVASESAFSTGGRVLDDFKTSLTPFMIQALICAQDWLRRSTPINVEEDAEELAKLEQELIEKYGGGSSSKPKKVSQSSHSIKGPGLE